MQEFYNSHRQRLFINADDFGISQRANRNILNLISLGKINRVGIMPTATSPKEIEELCRSGVKLDLHLDILHELGDKRSLRGGLFGRGLNFVAKIITRKISTTRVEADWRGQLESFHRLFGRYPDGINSHEHVHYFPPFFKLALKLASEFSIPYVRLGEKTVALPKSKIARVLHLLRKLNRKTFATSGIVTSGSLVSLDWISDLDYFLDHLPEGTVEIACHPELAQDFVKVRKYF